MRQGRRPRVALVGPSPHHQGGTGALIRLLLSHLPSAGIEARAVETDTPPSWLPPGLDRIRYLRTGIRFVAYNVRLVRAVLWADVLHAFAAAHLSFWLEPLPAIVVGRLLGKRVVLNYHTGEAEDHLRRSRRLVRWAARRADVFVVPSHFLRRIFGRAGIAALVVPNLVEVPSNIPPAPRDRVIVNTRALAPLYDIPTTLRAFSIIQSRWPDASLVLVAGGRDEEACRKLAAELDLRSVTFVGGVRHEEVPAYLGRSALFLNSSRVDNQPLSILEAFAYGAPVVSTAAGGISEIVRDGETGLLAPVGDYRALAERACQILGDPGLAGRLAQAGRAALAAHTWGAVRGQWLAVYGLAPGAVSTAPETRSRAASGVGE